MPKSITPSSFPIPNNSKIRRAAKKGPAHLYLRGNTYYFRYVLPQKFRDALGQSEVRLSLRTGFLKQARLLAQHLWICMEDAFVADRESTVHELKEIITSRLKEVAKSGVYKGSPESNLCSPSWLNDLQEEDGYVDKERLKDRLALQLNKEFPFTGHQTSPSPATVRNRMRTLLSLYLDDLDASLYDPASEIWIDNDKKDMTHSATDREWLEHEYSYLLKPIGNNRKGLIKAYFPQALHELVDRGLFKNSDFTRDNVFFILQNFHKIKIILNRILFHRSCGDFAYEMQFYLKNEEFYPHEEAYISHEPDNKYMLSEFIERYIETKTKDGQWVERAVTTHKNRLLTLTDILGDIPIDSIDRRILREFRDKLVRLPPNRGKKKEYKDKSIKELIELDNKKTLSIKTVNVTIQAISSMFEWGIREGYLEKNPAKGLILKDERQDIELREAFTEEEINSIFFHGDYLPSAFKNPAYYWVPLISLYTGMRLEEICQLHIEDIFQEEGIWIINISEMSKDGLEDKNLKTKNSWRKIPIHDDLIELGLLDYRQEIGCESKRLFPLLNKTIKSPKYGKQVGKHFSSWIKNKGITGKKSFHSLRHSFSDYFKKRNLQTDVFTQIFGHEQTRLASRQYGSKFSVKQCHEEIISKLKYK